MLVYNSTVNTIPSGIVAENTLHGNVGSITRAVEFINSYDLVKRVYTLSSGDVMTDVILSPRSNPGRASTEYLLYFKYFHSDGNTKECMLGDMSILQGCRQDGNGPSVNVQFVFASNMYGDWDLLLEPGEFVDVPNTDVLDYLKGCPEHPGLTPLEGMPLTWVRRTQMLQSDSTPGGSLSKYIPSCNIQDINPNPSIINRDFQGDVICHFIAYQHDYMHVIYDKIQGTLVVCDIVGFASPRDMAEEADMERHLRGLCEKYNLLQITITKTFDEVIQISIIEADLSVKVEVISIPLFVLTSYCLLEDRSSLYMI